MWAVGLSGSAWAQSSLPDHVEHNTGLLDQTREVMRGGAGMRQKNGGKNIRGEGNDGGALPTNSRTIGSNRGDGSGGEIRNPKREIRNKLQISRILKCGKWWGN